MNSTIVLATIAGLCGMLGWGFGDFFAKKTIDIVGDMATLAWAHMVGLVILLLLCAGKLIVSSSMQFGALPHRPADIVWLLFFGALQAVVYFFVYRAFAVGKVSLLNPVFSTYSGIVVVLSLVVFGEALVAKQVLLIVLTFVGVLLMSVEHDSAKLRKFSFSKMHGMRDIVIATGLASVWTLLWAHFVAGKDWLVYATAMYAAMSLTILIICAIQKINLRIADRSLWKYFAYIGIGEVVAYAGISRGYSLTTHTSVVAVLSAAFSVPTVILAWLFLKEKISRLQVAGVACVVGGGALLAFVS
jgi:drug/metabolite transporter (DMT)-like permease